MQRFLVRNQVPKPDPGIVNRAAKAKKHRKIEKIVEATLYKRRKLETRSAFLHEHEIQEPAIGHNKHTGMAGHTHTHCSQRRSIRRSTFRRNECQSRRGDTCGRWSSGNTGSASQA